MRKEFFAHLQKEMAANSNIWFLTGDLGYGLANEIRAKFPDRFINCGASEQAMLDIAVGLAYAGKIPFVYSITPFLLYRGYETLRTYINHEKLPVKLIGTGRDKDYSHDGFSHDASDAKRTLNSVLENFADFWPDTEEDLLDMSARMTNFYFKNKPCFLSLKR